MKQAVMTSPGVIEFRDVPVPKPGPNDVLVRIRMIGICGSDIHVRHGRHPFTSFPVVQGHEFSGIVEAVGRRVTSVRPGRKVTATPQLVCGRCAPCRRGDYHICDVLRVQGFQAPGCAQELFLVPEERIVPLPASFTFEKGALVEPAAVGVHAVSRAGRLAGANVAVLGAGPIGNLVGQAARAAGAKVLITDVSEYRLEIARACGLKHVSPAGRESLKEASARVFGARGFEKAFECAAAEAAMNGAIGAIQKGGTIVAVGVYGDRPRVDMGLVQDRELTLTGTLMYRRRDFIKAVRLIRSGGLVTKPLDTRHFPFEEYRKAYDYIDREGERSMKIFVDLDPNQMKE
ncbi:MAG TPA: alcohol dehydrogenase catalytic domain-containing protein [Candidatus Aminicenantes bacterium]|nr:alcohol dehydrogenase catalytic domain-containing protein [Candidatus Aminicenantes bacterium]HRY64586.1 alcohol dehydrogenase catalytic domain-containing protein [Candidatus Aminicenantes bacterium]HRZ71499.1 alcohol dehydrogenase catalytic domain-containing protein [Candidatus Aminicenantes bacterium]